MKLKRISALVLSLVLTAVNSNIIFCAEPETVDTEITAVEEAALSDSAIEAEITNADFASASSTVSYAVTGGNIYFDTSTGTITSCDTSVTEAVIPGEIEGVAVTSVGFTAFYSCYNLTKVILSDGVTSIGDYAFGRCSKLRNITLPEGIISIGEYAFYDCYNLFKISIPDSIVSIGEYAFYGCEITSIIIPDKVTSIGSYTFCYCSNLESITLSDSITFIGDYAFYSCYSLTSIDLPDSITSIGDYTFYNCSGLKSITLPNNITSVGDYAFYACGYLESITFSDNITSIGNYAFSGCFRLTDVILPNKIKSIGSYAFCDCYSVKSITLPDSITSIGQYAFYNCSALKSITLPNNITSIADYTFSSCWSLASIDFPESINSISDYAFSSCVGLTSVTFPQNITSISKNAFSGCKALEKVYCYKNSKADDSSIYPEGVTIIYLDSNKDLSTESTTVVEQIAAPTFKVVGVFGGRSVTFTSETDGAVIYYSSSTSNLTTDDICIANGETVTYEDYYGTIYARAYYNGVWSDVNKFVLKIPVVNTPTVTASGSVVTIKSTTPSSFICYTTDGTAPVVETDGTVTNGTWLKVNGARTNSGTVTANPGDTVTAVAVRSCFTTSEAASAYVSVSPAEFKVVGTFGGRNVTFTSATSGVKIYYSSTTSSLTTSDKCISNGETVLFEDFYGTIYARAYYNGKWSNVSRLILKIPTINDPTITYSGGKATIRTTTPNCYIYYTTDGSTPSISNGKKLCSNSYGQISVSSGTTVKAIAVRSCFTNSSVASYKVS